MNEVAISDQSGFVVEPNIIQYAVYGTYVVGLVKKMQRPGYEDYAGYFILNTSTGNVKCCLDKETWLRSLFAQKIIHNGEKPYMLSPFSLRRYRPK